MFHVTIALDEFGRDLVSERTQIGLEAARARGRKGGQPSAFSKWSRTIRLVRENSTQLNKIALPKLRPLPALKVEPLFINMLSTIKAKIKRSLGHQKECYLDMYTTTPDDISSVYVENF